MSFRIRLEDPDQTTVIVVDGDCASLQAFYGDPRDENPENFGAAMFFGRDGLEQLLVAIFRALMAMERESLGDFFRVMTNGFGCEAS